MKTALLASPLVWRMPLNHVGSSRHEMISTCGEPETNRKMTSKIIGRSCGKFSGIVPVVPRTISIYLGEAYLQSKCPFRVFHLPPKNWRRRLQWCRVRAT
ncbi:hypothetical protein TNCT_655791 [Trichonephila clavata]|uniref:Uncharacterized protein n=1 Tax=Trichonephila clavata TaxID=2740835 RepID=A0A8X6F5G3_TRICU|nr:hypothetical protein TNCT_655791 [Trichonephila clavata]